VKKLVLFGTTDFARIAHVYFSNDSEYEVVAFTVNREYLKDAEFSGLPVVPFEDLEQTHPPSEYAMFVAIGFSGVNKRRKAVYDECKAKGYELVSYVNSKAFQWGEVSIGDNCFIFEANVLQPYVTIGNNCILWSGNHIGHDVTIEDDCFIASHVVISGNTTIGRGTFIGVNATFRDGIVVGPENVIGAAAVIMKNTEPGAVHSVRHTEAASVKSWDLKNF
jgi:sugar O-acyltransferase (sialic acid O-acetyltransferase NeuD family)